MSSSKKKQIYILDGGFATQLCKHVDEPMDGTPLWSASFLHTNPDAVIETHLDFLRAGCDIISTNTYQASVDGFIKYLGLNMNESIQLIKKSVDLANSACSRYFSVVDTIKDKPKIKIAGSVGSYGTSLHDYSEYSGNYVDHVSSEEIASWHKPRIQALVEAGVDFLAFETIPAQLEAEILIELLKEFPDQRAWLSFSCKDDTHICHGEKFQDVARKCWRKNPSQLVAVGINCSNPKFVSHLIQNTNKRGKEQIPLIVYPNSGESYNTEKGWFDSDKCSSINTYVEEWLNLGVTFIGGCCRIYSTDIAEIKQEVNKWLKRMDVNKH